jgi:prefoldin subunit 5
MMRVEAKIELLQQDYERLNAFMENIMNLVRTLEEKVNNGPTTMYKASLRGK